jgi:hypothetical protein
MSDQNQDMAAVLQRLQSFQTKMDAALSQAQSRRNTMLVLMIIVIIAMACYLTFAFKQIKQVDASTAVYLMEAKAQAYLDQSAPELTERLKEQAPEVIGRVEKQMLAMPQAIGTQARQFVIQKVTEHVPGLEASLQKALSDAIQEAHKKHAATGAAVSDEEMRQIFDQMAVTYGQRLREMVETLHKEYVTNSKELLDHMRVLADSEDSLLNQREKLQRDLVIAVLALLEKYEPGVKKLQDNPPSIGM